MITKTQFAVMALVSTALTLVIAACAPAEPSGGGEGEARTVAVTETTGVKTWTDPETRCEYLIYTSSERGGITPRLKANGDPMCPVVLPDGVPPATTLPGF